MSTSLFHVTSSNNPCHFGLEAVSEGAINDTQFTDLPDHLGSESNRILGVRGAAKNGWSTSNSSRPAPYRVKSRRL